MNRARIDEHLETVERARLTWRLLRDPRVAGWMKYLLPVVALVYLISPIDLIPDVLLGLGQIDDLGVLSFALFMTTRLLPKLAPTALVEEHVADIRGGRRTRAKTGGDIIDAEYTVVDSNMETNQTRRGSSRREMPT